MTNFEAFISKSTADKLVVVPKGQEGVLYEYIEPEQLDGVFGGEIKNVKFWPPLDTMKDGGERLDEGAVIRKKLRPFYTVDEFDFEIFGDQIRNDNAPNPEKGGSLPKEPYWNCV